MSERKPMLLNFVVLGVGLLAGLVAAEMIAGYFLKRTGAGERVRYMEEKLGHSSSPEIGTYDPELGWGYKPHAQARFETSDFSVVYSINGAGLRDPERLLEKKDGVFRILALGESTIFGEGVLYGERLTDVIEKSLENVEVINMGVWGFGLDQSLLQLKRDGFAYKPDLVVLFILIDDYLQRCRDYIRMGAFKPRYVMEGGQIKFQDMDFVRSHFKNPDRSIPAPLVRESKSKTGWSSMLEKSHLYELVAVQEKRRALEKKLKSADEARWKEIQDSVSIEREAGRNLSREDFVKIIRYLLLDFQNTCRERGVKCLVVLNTRDHSEDGYIAEICRDSGIPLVDVTLALRDVFHEGSLTFRIDPHFNPAVHRVIGAAVARKFGEMYHLTPKRENE